MRSIILLRQVLLFVVCTLALTESSSAQRPDTLQTDAYHTARFEITSRDSVIVLPHQFIVNGSESVKLDSITLERNTAYTLQSRLGTIILHRVYIPVALNDSSVKHKLVVYYQSFPFTFEQSYRHREPVVRFDSATHQQILVAKPTKS